MRAVSDIIAGLLSRMKDRRSFVNNSRDNLEYFFVVVKVKKCKK